MIALALLLANQSATPTINPTSIYGLETFTTGAKFGLDLSKVQIAFAPENIDEISFRLTDETDSEITKGKFYETTLNEPLFRILRYTRAIPLEIEKPGSYTLTFFHNENPISSFPFNLTRKVGGDEFKPTFAWDFKTPVDQMAHLYYEPSDSGEGIYVGAWFAPGREGIPLKSTTVVTLLNNGKAVANSKDLYFSEPKNKRYIMRLSAISKMGYFTIADLKKLKGEVTLEVKADGKIIRRFPWKIEEGEMPNVFPRSQSSYEPRTDYWIPRYMGGINEGYSRWKLMEQYWTSNTL